MKAPDGDGKAVAAPPSPRPRRDNDITHISARHQGRDVVSAWPAWGERRQRDWTVCTRVWTCGRGRKCESMNV
ncbi:hypothetical protein E2C01_102398 [Portunus trituberculatus]|uniref:Uncharacterized protein n=1 Tax=Portunus trituberculatus TaxID=210409 RepID=A0A5B7KH78_PORTR|nr:hypothetical protein [Portunus trituberculatus]